MNGWLWDRLFYGLLEMEPGNRREGVGNVLAAIVAVGYLFNFLLA